MKLINIYIGFYITVLLIIGCTEMIGPEATDLARASSETIQNLSVQSYRIPKGIFRGVLWPSPNKPFFQIWLIKGSKDVYYDIPAPEKFEEYEMEVTTEWVFQLFKSNDHEKIYMARKKDNSKEVRITLPEKNREYTFNVLKNSHDDEIIIFMDISEAVIDIGLFGYMRL